MAWSRYQAFVVVLFTLTGTITTTVTKWANLSQAVGSDGKGPRSFVHPLLQTSFMFFGEMFCMVVFKILYFYYRRKQEGAEDEMKLVKGNRTFNQLVLFPPALCDLVGTSAMHIGLIFTYAASYQMLRGSVIVFVGLFSMYFLKRKLGLQEWGGIILLILGLALVGLCDFLSPESNITTQDYSTKDIIIGDLIIVAAQLALATQNVLEEKYVAGLDIAPLQAIGWEGVFGFWLLVLLFIPCYFIPVPESFSANPRNVLEDAIDGFVQMYNNQVILRASLVGIVSTGIYNFAGISVTKELSATTRNVMDCIRIVFIWMFTLGMGWQKFYWLQIVGFIMLVAGTLVYNRAFSGLLRCKKRDEETSATTADQETVDSSTDLKIEDSSTDKPEEQQS